MKVFSKEKQLFVNLISSLVVMVADFAISFFLSPFIVKNIGVAANGYVQLANNFVSYVTLLVTVINSMAGRFITIEYHNGNKEKASVYYTSVFFADLVLFALFIIPTISCIYKLEYIISIPKELLIDVKLLFFFVFMNFLAGLAFPMWGTATYITNTLYISSIGGMISKLIRISVIIGAFAIFVPKVWFVGFASFTAVAFLKVWNFIYKRKLLPELKIRKRWFRLKSVLELMSAGIWNAISNLGNVFISGFDLLICNMFVGTTEMGLLSIAKTLPNLLQTLSTTICGVFAPALTINYAKGNIEALKKDLKQAMNITGIILTIPLSLIFVFGDAFFTLWVPSQNEEVLHILSILTVIGYIFTCGTQVLYNVFVTVNKVKTNSIMMLLTGVLSTIIVLVCLKTTHVGVFAVAGVSSVLNIVRNMLYTVPFTAKYLGLRWHTFFPQVMKSVVAVVISVITGYIIKNFIPASQSWVMLIIACAVVCLVGFAINIVIVLDKEERHVLKEIVLKKIKKDEDNE